MAEAVSGRHRSIASIAAGTLLLVLALLEAGIAALFVPLASSERRTMLRIGNDAAVLYPDYAYNGIAIFLALCLISACGGGGCNRRLAWDAAGRMRSGWRDDHARPLGALDLRQPADPRFAPYSG